MDASVLPATSSRSTLPASRSARVSLWIASGRSTMSTGAADLIGAATYFLGDFIDGAHINSSQHS